MGPDVGSLPILWPTLGFSAGYIGFISGFSIIASGKKGETERAASFSSSV
jgi:hypothetical protein